MIVFDVDGTVLIHPGRPDYASRESLSLARPAPGVVAALRELQGRGEAFCFVTGRAPSMVDFTVQEIESKTGLKDATVHCRTSSTWRGWETYTTDKARRLKRLRAKLYIGDLSHDAEAARLAGCAYMHADDVTLDHLLPYLEAC